MAIRNALSIDVEDYFQVSGFERDVSRNDWSNYPSRVVANTLRILDILECHGIKATFFVLGWVADHFPALVREIDAAGHEVGSHSYWHRLVHKLTPAEFRDDLCRSRDLLQEIINKPVVAYRAPSFSITPQSLWALDILAREGFKLDSSVCPIRHDRGGVPNAPRQPHALKLATGSLWEFPPSVTRIGKVNLPISGGCYFRLYPYSVSNWLLQQVNTKDRLPFVFYIHPWEIDPDQPRLNVSSRSLRFRHYVNLSTTEAKLERLLASFAFGRLDDVLNDFFVAEDSSRRVPTDHHIDATTASRGVRSIKS